ncbi:hypothetical protein [Phocoenobacter atlanticus]|uniref:hypothetical protein n=1 Tax=Phocoenobacter atlanticus TaxID=3416742 RepID=UPI0027552D99|nr:hypothetical protein [Pasteurella atlantica]MDP8100696.1 hypothetical protein [Pasteurella atlantica]
MTDLKNRQQQQENEESIDRAKIYESKDSVQYEQERQKYFFYTVRTALVALCLLYLLLVGWIIFAKVDNAWHTTLALIIASTTVLIVLFRMLRKPEKNEILRNRQQILTLSETLEKLIELIVEKFKS